MNVKLNGCREENSYFTKCEYINRDELKNLFNLANPPLKPVVSTEVV